MRHQEALGIEAAAAVGHRQRLPAGGVDDLGRRIHRYIAGVIAVGGAAVEIAELVGTVVAAELDQRCGGDVAHALRGGEIAAGVGGVVAQARHLGGELRRAAREEFDQRAVGGEAHRLAAIGVGALGGRPTQFAAELRAVGLVVVRRPGVVHGGVHDGVGAREDRRRHAGGAYGLKRLVVPVGDQCGGLGGACGAEQQSTGQGEPGPGSMFHSMIPMRGCRARRQIPCPQATRVASPANIPDIPDAIPMRGRYFRPGHRYGSHNAKSRSFRSSGGSVATCVAPTKRCQPVFWMPAAMPFTVATSACSSASSSRPVSRQRCSSSTCSRLIGSTYGLRRRIDSRRR